MSSIAVLQRAPVFKLPHSGPSAPGKQVITKALNEVKLKPQQIIKGLKLELQVPQPKPATSVVNSLAASWVVALLLGLGAWQQSRRWQLAKVSSR